MPSLGVARRVGGGVQLGGVDARSLVDVVDAVAGGDGLGRVQRVADVDVGEQPVVAVALVLGRVELEGDGLAVERAPWRTRSPRRRSTPRARLGWTTSGVSMPMIRTVSMPLGSSTRTVSPSTTSTTVPARGAGVGSSVGVGSAVGDVVGATDGDGDSEADAVRVGEGVGAVTAATSWSVPPATAAAATMMAPTANRPIFLRDIRR